MSIINANPCNQKAPTIYTLQEIGDFSWIKTPNGGDIAMLVLEDITEFWVFEASYDGVVDGVDTIAGGCQGAWKRGGDVINAILFGADPTGVEDSSEAIALAISAMQINAGVYAGTLYFPRGRYRYTQSPTIANTVPTSIYGVRVVGDAPGATFLLPEDCDGFRFENMDNSSICNLAIQQRGAPKTQNGIRILRSTHIDVTKVDVSFFENGVYVPGDNGANNSHTIVLKESVFRENTTGFKSDGAAVNALRIIGGCEFAEGDTGIDMSGVSLTVRDCTIETLDVGIKVTAQTSESIVIHSNYFEGIAVAAIQQGAVGVAALGFDIQNNFYSAPGGGKFILTMGGFIQNLRITDNTFYPTLDDPTLIDLTASSGYPGATTSYKTFTVISRDVLSALALSTNNAAGAAGARNWALVTNVLAYGDIDLRHSNAAGGDPVNGLVTSRLYCDPNGIFTCGGIAFHLPAGVSPSLPALTFGGDTGTGFFRATTDVVAFGAAGTVVAQFGAANGVQVLNVVPLVVGANIFCGQTGAFGVFSKSKFSSVADGELLLTNAAGTGGSFLEGIELSGDPPSPNTDRGRLYYRDNGGGKTQLCVRFASGAVQVLATEP